MTDTIRLTVPAGPRGSAIVSLVLGGLGSRLDLPVDRIDELALATTSAGASVEDDDLELELRVCADRLLVRVGPLPAGGAAKIASGRVVPRLVDGVASIEMNGREWAELEVVRRTLT